MFVSAGVMIVSCENIRYMYMLRSSVMYMPNYFCTESAKTIKRKGKTLALIILNQYYILIGMI